MSLKESWTKNQRKSGKQFTEKNNINTETEITKRNQRETLKLKTTITKMKKITF